MTRTEIEGALGSDVLDYWFADVDDSTQLGPQHPAFLRWNAKQPEVDSYIRERYSGLYGELQQLLQDGWQPGAVRDRLGAILVLDQFPRHMFRGLPKMYATDELARVLTLGTLETSVHRELPLAYAMFLYTPLMHSERVEDQQQMLALFGELRDAAKVKSPHNLQFFEMSYGYARRHLEIVERFGRFPHRNAVLGRTTTESEAVFLTEPNSSF
ncbi:DUF924 domain-containing protein [Aquabacterium sp. A7-Y]|uniref:DUF924 family protein n=1 Tax=Aquabacterium sp. A7-Y TaxID=1349605 RepID=UPI00223DA98B|nr:DUF924 family protein [Aquabacterium sp. A7-Y]MCW7540984.1 DUF924 domain-containing protein [Aquabacterium sp. A7-Y]